MTASNPTRSGRFATTRTAALSEAKQLRSGRVVKAWIPAVEQFRKLRRRQCRLQLSRPPLDYFPFMELPVELRLKVYKYLLHASRKRILKRTRPGLRVLVTKTLGNGRVVVQKLDKEGSTSIPHSKSALPYVQIFATCKQIYSEATYELYRHNTFEVTARTPYKNGQPIFRIPEALQLDLVRYLVLVTDTDVSRFQSCFTYEVLGHMKALRNLCVAMKTAFLSGGPDFNSALEMLNLILWVSEHVELEFGVEGDLKHHDHPIWVSKNVLKMYVEMFADLRGAAIGRWTSNVSLAYSKALALANEFTAL